MKLSGLTPSSRKITSAAQNGNGLKRVPPPEPPPTLPVVEDGVIKQVLRRKQQRQEETERYRENSPVAFIVHSFNRKVNIPHLWEGLSRFPEAEVIVCDDGSLDGSERRWQKRLTRPNDFLIRSNDLHEIRILDRAVRFARAEIVCLVQDDDQIPPDSAWLEEALACFRQHPRLAVLGGFMGFRSFHPEPARAKPLWADLPFCFVHHVNIGPYFVRRSHYLEMGGWDATFSGVGEPGICFDSEFCLRAWIRGYQTGYRFTPFKGPAGFYALNGGTMLFSGPLRRRNQLRNHHKVYNMYKHQAGEIDRLVRGANQAAGIRMPR